MTNTIIAQQEVFFGGYRLTQQLNQIGESMTTAELNATVLGGETVIHEPGLKGYGMTGEGFWSATEDAELISKQRTRNVPVTMCLTNGDGGTPARSVLGTIASHSIGDAAVGELLPFSYEIGAMDAPVRGYVLHNGEETGNVTGTAYNLGAPGAGESVYGVLHVFSGSGSFDVKIQSATDEAFTTPNDRITFTTVATGTAQAYEWATPVSSGDAWWRITATNPATRDFAVIVAIQ